MHLCMQTLILLSVSLGNRGFLFNWKSDCFYLFLFFQCAIIECLFLPIFFNNILCVRARVLICFEDKIARIPNIYIKCLFCFPIFYYNCANNGGRSISCVYCQLPLDEMIHMKLGFTINAIYTIRMYSG